MWMQRWSHSTRAGQAAIPDSRRPDIRIGRASRSGLRAAPQPPRVDRTEPLAPRPNCLGGDRHASLREAIFGSADAAAEPMGEPDRVADDVGRESIAVIAGRRVPHRPILPLVAST